MSEIAILCLIHPKDSTSKSRIQSLLHQHLPYYHNPTSQCKVFTTFTPSLRKGAPSLQVPPKTKHLVIGTFELYTDKSALTTQLQHPSFASYHQTIKSENLYSQPEDLVAWTPRGGYFSRTDSTHAGKGVVVMTATFTCKDAAAAERVVARLAMYASWVKENEPEVLTYAVLSRKKAPLEVLMFERYANLGAIKAHGSSKEFKGMFRDIKGDLGGATTMNEWEEEGEGFVGNVAGGLGGAKL
jgi:quinol monooxygenase YgiN